MNRRLLLCTDLDRTLLPNGEQPESGTARHHFSALAKLPEITLVYVTGRHRALVQEAIYNYRLPQPDFAITDVGTRIYHIEKDNWHAWTRWETEISRDWGNAGWQTLRDLFRDLSALRLQETSKQNTHKLSFYVPLDTDHESLLAMMRERLAKRGVRASLTWSIDEPAAIGLLDVLPARATKLHAIEFLAAQENFALTEILFAGDSGNDLAVLSSAIPSVLVANASDTVRQAAQAEAADNGHADALYIARGGFLNMNGNYSAGILEGMNHFFPACIEQLAGKQRA